MYRLTITFSIRDYVDMEAAQLPKHPNSVDDAPLHRVSSLPEESHCTPPKKTMSTALDITKQAYEAFGRRDIPAFLKLVADEVDWKLIGPANWPHAGLRRNPTEVAAFFADLDLFDDLSLFEPREFIEAGENVTVLGYLESFARETKQKYHSDWVHVSTVRDSKITRWRGFANTAAPYGYL
jgi:ketosteroid isomerase-like protein